jgi:uncharacterized protein (DUF3084 family)
MKSKIKTLSKFQKKINQSTDNNERKNEAIQHLKENQEFLKDKFGKQSTAWSVH